MFTVVRIDTKMDDGVYPLAFVHGETNKTSRSTKFWVVPKPGFEPGHP